MVGFTDNIQFSGATLSDGAAQNATASANLDFTDSNNFLSASGAATLQTSAGNFNFNGQFTVTQTSDNGNLIYSFATTDPSGNSLQFSWPTNTPSSVANLTGTYGVASYTASGPLPATVTPIGGLCFGSGTRIAVPGGEKRVERLLPGDLVLATSGEPRRVIWTGSRHVDFGRSEIRNLWPYHVLAGAFGESRPGRDLWLSPDHSVAVTCLSEVLIPIKHLDNGATVAQVPVEEITYWHVELDRHDLLMAENMPAESFLDTRGRAFFENATLSTVPRATLKTIHDFCRPLVTEGPIIDAVRLQLLARARQLGWTLTDHANLHAIVDGSVIRPEISDAIHFTLPAGAGDVRLVSRAFVPRHTDVKTFDNRRLGVPIRALSVSGGQELERVVSLDDPALISGFHPAQDWDDDRWRWTDGAAVLSRALWDGRSGPVTLSLQLAPERGALRAWLPPEARAGELASAA